MTDFYQTARLTENEQATLAEAINGTNIEHLLAAVRRTFNKDTRATLAELAKTRTMTADTATAACGEIEQRTELLRQLLHHLPDTSEAEQLLNSHQQAHKTLTAAKVKLSTEDTQ